MKPRLALPAILAAASVLLPSAWGIEPSVLKLTTNNVSTAPGNHFGTSVAVNEKWVLVGEPKNDEDGSPNGSGAVHVYNAVSGVWTRMLKSTSATDGALYGQAVAIQGDIAIIGAPGQNSGKGGVFVVNVATGVEVRTLELDISSEANFGNAVAIAGDRVVVAEQKFNGEKGRAWIYELASGNFVGHIDASDGLAGDRFGASLAAEGPLVLVGAPSDYSDAGSVYLFDVRNGTGAEIHKKIADSQTGGDLFGSSVAFSGTRVLVGAPGRSGGGAAFAFHTWDQTPDSTLLASDRSGGDRFGASVALRGNLALVGAPSKDSGVAYLFDLETSAEKGQLVPYGMSAFSTGFAEALAAWGNNAVVGTPLESFGLGSTQEGSASFYRQLVGALPLVSVAVQGSYAPGAFNITYSTLGEASLNEQGEVGFASKLAGTGSGGGKDTGGWTDLPGTTKKVAKSREEFSTGILYSAVSNITCNANNTMTFRATLTGTGVSKTNNQMAGLYSGTNGLFWSLRTGTVVSGIGSPVPSSLLQVVQPRSDDRLAAVMKFTVGTSGVTLTSDSGALFYTSPNATLFQEGAVEPGGGFYGEFLPRIGYGHTRAIWAAARTGLGVTTADNQALYLYNGSATTKVVTKGEQAAETSGALFSSFLGESVSSTNKELYRALLSTGSTTANNEGVWQGTGGSAKLVARKGVQANGLATGVLWNRILKYWPVGDQVIVFGVVKGPGVSAANDQVVVLFQSDATSKLLMREGDLAPGCDGLKIGVIQQVQASMSGNYLVLASLTGAKSDSNQALFGGDATAGTTSNFGIRLPLLKLRKGTRYQSVIGTAARLKNITMSALGTDSSGVGGKGLSHSVNDDGDIAITLDLDNGGRQLVRGQL